MFLFFAFQSICNFDRSKLIYRVNKGKMAFREIYFVPKGLWDSMIRDWRMPWMWRLSCFTWLFLFGRNRADREGCSHPTHPGNLAGPALLGPEMPEAPLGVWQGEQGDGVDRRTDLQNCVGHVEGERIWQWRLQKLSSVNPGNRSKYLFWVKKLINTKTLGERVQAINPGQGNHRGWAFGASHTWCFSKKHNTTLKYWV